MAAQADIRTRVFSYLYGSGHVVRPLAHRINGAYTVGGSTVTVDDGTKFEAGDVIEFQDDGEQMRVESVSTNTLTVETGLNGTTNANHADNVVIFKNPRFTWAFVDQAITEAIQILEYYNIYQLGTGTITLVANQDYYDLTEADIVEAIGVLNVYEQEANSLTINPLPFHYWAGIHATLSTTGHGLQVWDKGNTNTGSALYFTYAQQIAATTDLTTPQEEIVVLGAVARAMGTDINPRTADPGKRTDRTVQPGQATRDGRWFLAAFQRALWQEEARLAVQVNRRTRATRHTARVRRWVW